MTSPNIVDQLDDPLGHVVAGRRLGTEQERAGNELLLRIGFDAVVEPDDVQALLSNWRLYSCSRFTITSNNESTRQLHSRTWSAGTPPGRAYSVV